MEKDPLTDALRYHPFLATPLSTRHLFTPPTKKKKKTGMCLLHFPFLAFFTRFGRWTSVFFSPPRARVWSSTFFFFFVLPAQVEIGAFVFISSSPPQTFSLFYYYSILRGVEAPWKPGEVGFFAGRLAPRSSLYPREEKQPMCIPVFFPFSSCYISVCLCATTNRTSCQYSLRLITVFALMN